MKSETKKRVVFEFSKEQIDHIHGKLDVQALLTKCKNLESELSALREDKVRLLKAAIHFSVCDFPDEVDFRCPSCVESRATIDAARKP